MITPYSNTIQVTTEKFPFEFTINTANTSLDSSAADQFRLPLVSSLPLNAVVDWGDGSSDTITVFNQPEVTHTYNTTTTTEFTISITGDLSGWRFANGGDKLKMLNVSQWSGLNISTDVGFWGCTNLTATATDAPLITTTSLSTYFAQCTNFNGDIGNWNVSNVTNFFNFMAGKTAANYSAENLASIYNGWSQLTLQPNLTINFNTIDYCDTAEANKQSIVTNFGWTISDGNAVPCP